MAKSKVRDIVNDKSDNTWYKWSSSIIKNSFATTFNIGVWTYSNARSIGWFVVTTGLITALPLIFEIKRETALEELEKIQINTELVQGKTPIELVNSGLTGAVEPKVLS